MTKPHESAYPFSIERGDRKKIIRKGLTKREYFAIQCMKGRLSRDAHHDSEEIAKAAVRDANALVKELNETE